MGMQQTVSEELKLHVCVCMRACVFVCARTHTDHMPGGGAGISGFAVKFTCFSFKKKIVSWVASALDIFLSVCFCESL